MSIQAEAAVKIALALLRRPKRPTEGAGPGRRSGAQGRPAPGHGPVLGPLERVLRRPRGRAMIRVELAEEPASFDARVRRRGLSAISELVGEGVTIRRPGPRRRAKYASRDRIAPDDLPPYWTEALPELLDAYDRICAFTSLYIHRVTGAPSVDHMIPKSGAWDRVYEWSNYRLACALVNARKAALQTVLDPFEIEDWFTLELVGYPVLPRDGLPAAIRERVEHTIEQLDLNHEDCRLARGEYVEATSTATSAWPGSSSARRSSPASCAASTSRPARPPLELEGTPAPSFSVPTVHRPTDVHRYRPPRTPSAGMLLIDNELADHRAARCMRASASSIDNEDD